MICCVLMVLATSVQASTFLNLLWTYDSGVLPDGRTVFGVGLIPSIGTDGSVAFTVDVQGAGGSEQRLYWFDKAQDDPAAPEPILESSWISNQYQVLAVRLNHLIYGVIDFSSDTTDIYSLVRSPGATAVAEPSAATATIASSAVSSMIEQSRGPGVMYVFEGDIGDPFFKLHAYEILPVNTEEILVPTVVGVDSGNLTLRFVTQADAMYQLERSSDLITWVTDGSQLVGSGQTLVLQRQLPSSGQEFYRLRKL